MKILLDLSGWLGSFMVLLSYALTLSKSKDFSVVNRYLNLMGGILIAVNCLYYKAMPSFVTNVIWSLIAFVSLYRARQHLLKNLK
ncbi:CBU_0592 family membrane protein [Robertkochia solimangrovi]|uniref:CBU_0592 family membrane protein n=1 Tax=Robertkochia solimangrovi TaxID=2213046 RepID=UPI0011815BEB|nr:hypothetical protein [Robertkochia solimangrovi]TRZ43569.1 hypothetical protein DMZ48_09100 [Robertkochia solimangrovi]